MRKVFFSFDYDRDIHRVAQVRNCQVVTNRFQQQEFIDSASWEAVRREGVQAIRDWINRNLQGTLVTVVLIGSATAHSRWVNYEIERSIEKGNGLLGIHIHGIRNLQGNPDAIGEDPLNRHYITTRQGTRRPASDIYQTYDWQRNFGRDRIGYWIEEAAKNAER